MVRRRLDVGADGAPDQRVVGRRDLRWPGSARWPAGCARRSSAGCATAPSTAGPSPRAWRGSRRSASGPSTTTRRAPVRAAANSTLPTCDGATMLPATRMTNRSPRPWSKTISAGTRESEQPRMTANGSWFGAVSSRRLRIGGCRLWADASAANRRLPSRRRIERVGGGNHAGSPGAVTRRRSGARGRRGRSGTDRRTAAHPR